MSSFIIPFFFGRFLSFKGVISLIVFFSIINVLFSIFLLVNICFLGFYNNFFFFFWITLELVNIRIGFLVDPLACSMLLIITFISCCAIIYSIEYLSGDPHLNRYFACLSLFTFFMLLLVLSENIIQLFIGWEGVGICSYLLINYWFCRYQANKSSILAILANKIGDLTLLCSGLLIQFYFKFISFNLLSSISFFLCSLKIVLSYNIYNNYYTDLNYYYILDLYNINLEFISILIIISCIGKSAQFGFHIWLPEAMEGPTPVSSLIHAATMVTAGIFLILRISNLLVHFSNSFIFIIFIGSVTLFFAATIGFFQVDIKKIIAYSTCSQLGYMFLSCGLHNYIYSMYHLFIHAFFKALLFLTSGYIIHLLSNEQDIRKMGGLLKIMPFSYILLLIGSYSLIGFPYLSGFYSKEPLFESIINYYHNSFFFLNNTLVPFILILSLVTMLITLLYSLKSLFFIYFSSFRSSFWYIYNINYGNWYLYTPLVCLCICSIYNGYLFQDLMVGVNSDFLSKSLYIHQSNVIDSFFIFFNSIDTNTIVNTYVILEFYPYYRFLFLHILVYTLLLYLILKLYITNFYFYIFFNKLLYISISISLKYIYFSRLLLVPNTIFFINICNSIYYFLLDKGLLEILGPFGITSNLIYYLTFVYRLQTGYVYHYLGYIYISLVFILLLLLWMF